MQNEMQKVVPNISNKAKTAKTARCRRRVAAVPRLAAVAEINVKRASCAPPNPFDDPDYDPGQEALPGIPYASDVFPEDCLGLKDAVPATSLARFIKPGAKLPVGVAQIYSPSHFWIHVVNPDLEDITNRMNLYYKKGEGRTREMLGAQLRVGMHCACPFDADWNRAVIVKRYDWDTVKVRYIDYGTILKRCDKSELRPLLHEFATLEAQAVRARLAGARPACGARNWPHAASLKFLDLVQDETFTGTVTSIDSENGVVELDLAQYHTSMHDWQSVTRSLIQAGHAAEQSSSAFEASDSYLLPDFSALESGATPSFGEIHQYLLNGVALKDIEDYRRHVLCSQSTSADADDSTDAADAVDAANATDAADAAGVAVAAAATDAADATGVAAATDAADVTDATDAAAATDAADAADAADATDAADTADAANATDAADTAGAAVATAATDAANAADAANATDAADVTDATDAAAATDAADAADATDAADAAGAAVAAAAIVAANAADAANATEAADAVDATDVTDAAAATDAVGAADAADATDAAGAAVAAAATDTTDATNAFDAADATDTADATGATDRGRRNRRSRRGRRD